MGETSADPLRLQERKPAGCHRISAHHVGAGEPQTQIQHSPTVTACKNMIIEFLVEDVHDYKVRCVRACLCVCFVCVSGVERLVIGSSQLCVVGCWVHLSVFVNSYSYISMFLALPSG